MVQPSPPCTLSVLLTLSWLSCDCFHFCCLHSHYCVCVWMTERAFLSATLPYRHTQHRHWPSHTLWFIHSTVQYAPDLSAPSLLSSLLLARLCPPPPALALHPLWPLPPLPFPSYTQTHRNIFIHTHTMPWSRNLHMHTNTHAHTHTYTRALTHKYTHAFVMWCALRHGVQMSGISVLALATLSTTGGLYRRKNQQNHSHEAPSWSHTQTRAHTCMTRPCTHMCPGIFMHTRRQYTKNQKGGRKTSKNKSTHTCT